MAEKEKSAVKLYTGILKADIRNKKEDVPILTHPHDEDEL
jgi:hypothetical protein